MNLAALADLIAGGPAPDAPVIATLRLRVRYPDGGRAYLQRCPTGCLHLLGATFDARTCPIALWVLPHQGVA